MANPSCRAAGQGRHHGVVHSDLTAKGVDGNLSPAAATVRALGRRVPCRDARVSLQGEGREDAGKKNEEGYFNCLSYPIRLPVSPALPFGLSHSKGLPPCTV